MPTKHLGTQGERRALDAYIKLARAHAAVDARINRPLAEHGLTVSQFGVLEALLHLGPLSQRELGRKILRSSGNVTLVIDNLCRGGLVRRLDDPVDRRVRRIELTERGRATVEDALPRHVERVRTAFSCLTAEEQEALAALLRRLGHANAADDETRPAPERRAPMEGPRGGTP